MGLSRYFSIALAIALLTLVSSCIKEIELDREDNPSYIFIDGNIVVGEDLQQLTIGRTNGVGTAIPTPLRRAVVRVENYTNGLQHFYRETSTGEYTSRFEGQLGSEYQLFITLDSGESFSSDTIRLNAAANLVFSGDVDASIRVDASGDSIVTNIMSATVNFQMPSTILKDLLVFRSSFEYAISDLICGPFDGAIKCYYKDDISVDRFSLVDLSRFSAGESGTLQIGSYGIDARMAEESIIIADISRVDENARPYYRSIASSLSLGGNFFSPQPLTIPGNVVADENVNDSVLGYFGVIERLTLVLRANSNEIIRQSGLPFCSGGTANLPQFDCCYCFTNPGATTTRPSYWP